MTDFDLLTPEEKAAHYIHEKKVRDDKRDEYFKEKGEYLKKKERERVIEDAKKTCHNCAYGKTYKSPFTSIPKTPDYHHCTKEELGKPDREILNKNLDCIFFEYGQTTIGSEKEREKPRNYRTYPIGFDIALGLLILATLLKAISQ